MWGREGKEGKEGGREGNSALNCWGMDRRPCYISLHSCGQLDESILKVKGLGTCL